MYNNFSRVIDMVNVIISNYETPDMGEILISPQKGNCAFGSGMQCWGFTITAFARIYANKFKLD